MTGRLIPAGLLVLATAFAAVPVYAHAQEPLRASEEVELIQLERDWDHAFLTALINGENNGELWEWHTKAGWKKVPGSESAGATGVELSRDGQWLYIAQCGTRTFARLSRGKDPVTRDVIALGFRVDNVRWAPDGTLLVAGQGGPDCAVLPQTRDAGPCNGVATSTIGKVDPKKWTYTQLVDYPTSNVISAATVALQIGDQFWSGSFRGDRLALYSAKRAKSSVQSSTP